MLSSPTISQIFHLFALKPRLDCRKIAETYLQVTLLDGGSPCVQDDLFPELPVGALIICKMHALHTA